MQIMSLFTYPFAVICSLKHEIVFIYLILYTYLWQININSMYYKEKEKLFCLFLFEYILKCHLFL